MALSPGPVGPADGSGPRSVRRFRAGCVLAAGASGRGRRRLPAALIGAARRGALA